MGSSASAKVTTAPRTQTPLRLKRDGACAADAAGAACTGAVSRPSTISSGPDCVARARPAPAAPPHMVPRAHQPRPVGREHEHAIGLQVEVARALARVQGLPLTALGHEQAHRVQAGLVHARVHREHEPLPARGECAGEAIELRIGAPLLVAKKEAQRHARRVDPDQSERLPGPPERGTSQAMRPGRARWPRRRTGGQSASAGRARLPGARRVFVVSRARQAGTLRLKNGARLCQTRGVRARAPRR